MAKKMVTILFAYSVIYDEFYRRKTNKYNKL